MPAPATTNHLLEFVHKSGLHEKGKLEEYLATVPDMDELSPTDLANRMIKDGMLTDFQAKHLLKGRYRNFFIGKFKVLEPLGLGGMSQVYLCEHAVMKHRVAMKLLPVRDSEDKTVVSRFMREARAAAAVNHPNVVRAHDFDLAEKKFYYLIMDFVDGCSLHDLVKKLGPLEPHVAAHYILQAAHGLNHILECGLIHRDLKPSNLLLDRTGTIRILDLGLARFTNDEKDNLTRQLQGKSILGTADYLAPEQAILSDNIDIRADIYSLGATLYFLLSGRAPFENQSVTQKLLAHQIREPDPLVNVPDGLANICKKMMEKKPEDRYQSPLELIDALAEWTAEPLPLPCEEWFTIRAGGIQAGNGQVALGNSGSMPALKPPPSTKAMHAQPTPVRTSMPPSRTVPPPSSNAPGVESSSTARVAEFDPMEELPYPLRKKKTIYWVVAVISAIVMIGAAILALMYTGKKENDTRDLSKNSSNGNGSPGTVSDKPSGTTTTPDGSIPPAAIVVGPNGVATIAEALTHARSGSRIVVTAEKIEERTLFTASANGISIESWPTGRTIPWVAPANSTDPTRTLIQISNVEGLRLKGFDFDGKKATDSLIHIDGFCPGLKIEDTTIRDYRLSGMDLSGAHGDSNRSIRFDQVRFLCNSPQATAIRVLPATRGNVGSRNLSVTNCRFEGVADTMGTGIRLNAPLEDVEFRQNRFAKLNRAFHFNVKPGERATFSTTVANNCFFSLDAGFELDSFPQAGSNLNLTNNLFLRTAQLAKTAAVDGRPLCTVPDWVVHSASVPRQDGKVTGAGIAPGTFSYRKSFTIGEIPKETLELDIGAVGAFKVWLNGEPIGESRYPYFDNRIYSFPVAGKLKVGKNVLAVEVRHVADPINPDVKSATGLMARIGRENQDQNIIVKTDSSWKSIVKPNAGWQTVPFDDAGWANVHVWTGDSKTTWPWSSVVWDSAVKVKRAGNPALPITSAGNVRDEESGESYPLLGSVRASIDIKPAAYPQNPEDDATFLRSPRGSKLNTAGPDGSPVGVTVKD
ncbi:MAG: protein kinase [Gemmataceae bacterium]